MSVNRHIAFGAHNEPNQKNEDRGSMYMDHAADGCPHMASFSVFDGHNGSVAASLCAEYFNRRVVKRIQKLLGVSPASNASLEEPTSAASPLSRRDEVDAIVCESIRLSVVEIDMNIQLNHHSGCSINSLFLLFSPETSAVRVYCANLGTSRTVMFAPTIDRTWTSSRDSSCDETQDTFAGKESIATESVNSDNFSRETPVVAFLMNDSPRRSSSVDSTESDFACKPLPADPTKGQNAQGSSPDDDCAAPVGVVEQGYPAQPLMDQAERFLSAFKSTVDIGPKIYDVSAVDNMCLVIDRTGSFSNDVRLHALTRATPQRKRSVGDKNLSFIGLPIAEISAMTVPANKFARFVMSSDGVWEVMSVEEARRTVMKYSRPGELALVLSEMALGRRIMQGIRIDDISTIVVDINPELFPKRENFGCCCLS